MKRAHTSIALVLLLLPMLVWAQSSLPAETTTSTVIIMNYTAQGNFRGWGSGFFVDEGIVVTNKHVIENGDYYHVYATTDERVNFDCVQKITKSDVKINLNDDVAYMRVYLPCEHGMLDFGDDPDFGDDIWVIGYPFRNSIEESMFLATMSGSVTGYTDEGWLSTDAYLDLGISGGPVVRGTEVVGVAVAKSVDEQGYYVEGYFIPASVIERGLLYANDSTFGYTPRSRASSSRISSAVSSVSSASASSAVGSSRSSAASSRAASAASSEGFFRRPFQDVPLWREGYAAILSLYELGVIAGYPDGTYRPDAGINRAEFIKILVAGFRREEMREETGCFSDVADEWFASYVCAAKRLGWIDGYPDGTFLPSQLVNRAEAMKIITSAFGERATAIGDMPSDVRAGTWFYPYVALGVDIGIVDPDERFRPGGVLTREDGAIWIHGAAE